MREALLEILADPLQHRPLALMSAHRDAAGDIVDGTLESGAGARYDITSHIPRFVANGETAQGQVERSFAFKWQQQHTYRSAGMVEQSREWLVSRYGFRSADDMCRYMSERSSVLDAGCGAGWSASLWLGPAWTGMRWVGADISVAIDVARSRLSEFPNTDFVQADILHLPFRPETFDVIFAEGVLHHTPSTERAFHALVPLLRPGGEVMAYVYRRKSPVREFTDDYIRAAMSKLDPEEAWAQLRSLTALGQALAALKAEVDVPEPIPCLGIPAGKQDVQRLVYWHFAKLFWNDAYSFEENNHINFDWYHPAYAHRHTEEEIRGWCAAAKLHITHFDAQESGFTVRATRA